MQRIFIIAVPAAAAAAVAIAASSGAAAGASGATTLHLTFHTAFAQTFAVSERPAGLATRVLDDAALLLLVALLFPLPILLIGVPVALVVRLVTAIAQRL